MKRLTITGSTRSGVYEGNDPDTWLAQQIDKKSFGEDTASYIIDGPYDITLEVQQREQKKADRKAAQDWLKTNKGNIMSLPELNEAFYKLLESLGY